MCSNLIDTLQDYASTKPITHCSSLDLQHANNYQAFAKDQHQDNQDSDLQLLNLQSSVANPSQ
jgi:hypothetical protein